MVDSFVFLIIFFEKKSLDMLGMDVLGLTSNPGYKAPPCAIYASSVSSSSSSSSSSVFSLDGPAQSISSVSTNPVDVVWENDSDPTRPPLYSHHSQGPLNVSKIDPPVPAELRKNPRRSNSYVAQNGVPCPRPPPCLMRQSERKVNFVDNLVGKSFSLFSSSIVKTKD